MEELVFHNETSVGLFSKNHVAAPFSCSVCLIKQPFSFTPFFPDIIKIGSYLNQLNQAKNPHEPFTKGQKSKQHSIVQSKNLSKSWKFYTNLSHEISDISDIY